ncbi:hypothetical protein INR49_011179 [Caranx melampygus]|nr:hypothetical protein INR49_011179 [Caranx melampygus]
MQRPPALRVQNCSCSKLCLMSQPLSLSRELMSDRIKSSSTTTESSSDRDSGRPLFKNSLRALNCSSSWEFSEPSRLLSSKMETTADTLREVFSWPSEANLEPGANHLGYKDSMFGPPGLWGGHLYRALRFGFGSIQAGLFEGSHELLLLCLCALWRGFTLKHSQLKILLLKNHIGFPFDWLQSSFCLRRYNYFCRACCPFSLVEDGSYLPHSLDWFLFVQLQSLIQKRARLVVNEERQIYATFGITGFHQSEGREGVRHSLTYFDHNKDGGRQPHHSAELRIVLIGGRQIRGDPSHKSATGNIILGKSVFETNRRTAQSVVGQQEVHGRKVTVVDTPGWWWHYPLENTPKLDQIEITNSVHLCDPGPHAFLLVIPVGGKTPPAHLKLVMVGAHGSAKSSAGNCILGKKAFAVKAKLTTTKCCEMSHSEVAGRKLTVVDSPGWLYNHTLQDTCKRDKLEIENSMNLCPPGPHAVLLMVGLASAFNESYKRSVQEHMSLFTDTIWKHTVVVFTRGEWLGGKTVEERIESEKGLQWLVEMCGNRYHVLSNSEHSDETQVTELLEKIEEMLAGNKDPHYEVNVQRKKAIKEFHHKMNEMITCVKYNEKVAGVNITVVETPGWLTDDTMTPDWLKDEVEHGVSLCAPGPHVFLLVVPISKAFMEEDRKTVVELLKPFGETVWRYCMVLFTWGDWLNSTSIEQHIAGEGKPLQWLVEKCQNRYYVVSFHWSLPDNELQSKMNAIILRNKGRCFNKEDNLKKKLKLPWQAKWSKLSEEEWERREQELIDRMLKAVLQEPDEPVPPSMKTASSMNLLPPHMSEGVPSEYGSTASVADSGLGSTSAASSYMENLDEIPLIE